VAAEEVEMTLRRTAFIAGAACASVFTAVMAWDVVMEHPRLAGSQVCIQDAGSAQAFGAPGPGAYEFDRDTGRPVRIPASMAFAMVFQGISKASYPGQAACGAKALTQTPDGLIAVVSLLGTLVALLIGAFARARS
jgi:hypothetical protein